MIIQEWVPKKKKEIDARKETNQNKSYQGEYRQAVDDYTRMGAKKKTNLYARQEINLNKKTLPRRKQASHR